MVPYKWLSRSLIVFFILSFGLFVLSCSLPAQVFPLKVGTQLIQVELALTPGERALGLMHREQVPPLGGMLFLFEEEQPLSFWMKNTLVPLSIAYINKKGVIRRIRDMEPLSLQGINSDYSVQFALEVNQGSFQSWGVKEGTQVDLAPLFVQMRKELGNRPEYKAILDRLPSLETDQK